MKGVFFFESFGTKDTAIIEEIAKTHKVDVEIVAKSYKKLLEEIKPENEVDA